MHDLQLATPEQLDPAGDAPAFPLSDYALHFLAQGDSWFSVGAIPPWLTSNLFDDMVLSRKAVAVNCARPGAELRHMTTTTRAPVFRQLLAGARERPWTALLLSGLGNDLISASQAGPQHPAALRILATQPEWGAGGDADRYVSAAGWATFEAHAHEVFDRLLALRAKSRDNRDLPIVVHTYDFATPRNAGAGLGFGPWLFKAVTAFGIPEADWPALGVALQRRVRRLILDIAAQEPTVRVVDTQGTLEPARTDQTGPSRHWQNEIHPTTAGYRLLGDVWEKELERWFCQP